MALAHRVACGAASFKAREEQSISGLRGPLHHTTIAAKKGSGIYLVMICAVKVKGLLPHECEVSRLPQDKIICS